jgi:hypothetical protein
MNPLQIFLTIVSIMLVFGLPAFVLFKVFQKKLSLSTCITLIAALESIFFSVVALFFGYEKIRFLLLTLVILLFFLSYFILPVRWKKVFQKKVDSAFFKAPLIEHNSLIKSRKLLFLLAIIIFFSVPLITNVPFDVDSQGFGMISLMVKLGGTVTTLAPFFSEVEWVYSPAFYIFVAFFSDLSGAPIHVVMSVFSAFISILVLFMAYEFGKEIKNSFFGLLFFVSMLLGTWLFTSYLDSHYPTLLGTLFALVFLRFFFSYLRDRSVFAFVFSVISLAALAYSHPDTLLNLLIAFVPFYLFIFISKREYLKNLTIKHYLRTFVFIPFLSALLFVPYLLHIVYVLTKFSFEHMGFTTELSHIVQLFFFGGVIVPVLSVIGLFFAFRQRRPVDVLMFVWFFAVIEFSILGIFGFIFSLLPFNPASLMYPFGTAWHAPIIPYSFLAALAIYAFFGWLKKRKSEIYKMFEKSFIPILSAVLLIIVVSLIFSNSLLILSKKLSIPLFGEFASEDDVNAMLWLKANTPVDSYILNYPYTPSLYGSNYLKRFEGHWVPVISERKSVYSSGFSFAFNQDSALRLKEILYPAYIDPKDPGSKELIYRYGVDYVIVPQIMGNSSSFAAMYRWRAPAQVVEQNSSFEDADYLELVYNSNGAKVFRVI